MILELEKCFNEEEVVEEKEELKLLCNKVIDNEIVEVVSVVMGILVVKMM